MAKFLRYLALVLALTACNGPLPIADYISDARSPNAKITTKPSRFDAITFRSFRAGSLQEVAGADCVISTPNISISAQFRTPAQVRVPIYNEKPANIAGQCRSPNDETGLAAVFEVTAVNLSAPKNEGVSLSVGTSGTKFGAVFGLRDRSKDRFKYPAQFRIIFHR
jgi:hypothetical protein